MCSDGRTCAWPAACWVSCEKHGRHMPATLRSKCVGHKHFPVTLIKHTTTPQPLATNTRLTFVFFGDQPQFTWNVAFIASIAAIHIWSQTAIKLTDHSTVSTPGLLWEHLVSLAHWDPASMCQHSQKCHREEHQKPLWTLMVSIRTCTDAATKDVPCKLQRFVTWCENCKLHGSMKCHSARKFVNSIAAFLPHYCPNFQKSS